MTSIDIWRGRRLSGFEPACRKNRGVLAATVLFLGCASVAAAAEVDLLATGQTLCYEFDAPDLTIACAGTGQDADLLMGKELAYEDLGDGRIQDLNTGLQWEKKSDDGGIHDKDKLYDWYDAKGVHVYRLNHTCQDNEHVFCANDDACQATPSGKCGFAGYQDWRLPNVRELLSIAKFEIVDPGAITPVPRVPPVYYNNCVLGVDVIEGSCVQDTVIPYTYWTSTSGDALGDAYFVDFETADIGAHAKHRREHFEKLFLLDAYKRPLYTITPRGKPVFQFTMERSFAGHVRAVRSGVTRKIVPDVWTIQTHGNIYPGR